MRAFASPRVLVAGAATAALLGLGVASASPGPQQGRGGHGSACAHGAQLERNKRNVVNYYTHAFNDQEPEDAVRLYVGDRYIQHNPLAADGTQAFIDFVNSFTAQFPQLNVDIKRVIAECDLVMTHSHLTLSPSDRGSAVADIFRLDRGGKIVEHWDVIQAVPETSANDNTMF
jgi:predicted SnoaL-like aldol condensation-catalyzing enzyme